MSTTHLTFCRICESLCGLEVEVEDDRVVRIRPDQQHVATEGFACKKGLRQHELYSTPDRLASPMRRQGDRFEAIDWQTANQEIGEKLRSIIQQHGPNAVALYVGTAAGFSVLHPVFAQGFLTGLGSTNTYASATQDCANKFAVADQLYGFPFIQPFPDLEHTECLIIVGANPMVSKWSFLQVPGPRRHINAIRERGGRVIVVDPRKNETAKAAGEHVFIQPGSDAVFYAAFLSELIEQNGIDQDVLNAHTTGFDEVAELVQPWTPEAAEQETGIPPEILREMVSAYARADGAALYCSTGVNMSEHGTTAFWLQEVINLASGNLDRRGGTLVGKGLIDFPRFGRKNGLLVSEERSRIGGFKKTNDAFPGGILADEIMTPGPGQIRALIVTGGNPLITMADSDRLLTAFKQLDLLVTLDILPTETASAGHYMLPCTSPLERPDLPFIFPLMLGMQSRPYLQATQAVLPPHGEARDEATIYTDLARAVGRPLFGSKIFQGLLGLSQRFNRGRVPQRGWLSLLLRACGQKGFKHWLGHGRLRAHHEPGSFLGERVCTGDGKIRLAVPALLARLKGLRAAEPDRSYPFRLISKREVATHNSFGHNFAPFLQNDFDRNFVYMHPADAESMQLTEDALADVATSDATIRLPVRLTSDLLPGVVAVPHGWGHQASGQLIARESQGVNVNLLARSGPEHVDNFSGMSTLTAIPVSVRPAQEQRVAGNWSGVPG